MSSHSLDYVNNPILNGYMRAPLPHLFWNSRRLPLAQAASTWLSLTISGGTSARSIAQCLHGTAMRNAISLMNRFSSFALKSPLFHSARRVATSFVEGRTVTSMCTIERQKRIGRNGSDIQRRSLLLRSVPRVRPVLVVVATASEYGS